MRWASTSRSSAASRCPGRGEGDAGAELDLGPLERDVEGRVELGRAVDLLGGGVGVALGERGLAERVRERGQRVGVTRRGRDARQRVGARARLAEPPWRAKKHAAQRRPQTA